MPSKKKQGAHGSDLETVIERAGGVRASVELSEISPMLAETREQPFSRDGYLFELKYDGYRLLAQSAPARLRYRSGLDATVRFPEVVAAVAALPAGLILDGEVVVGDDAGRPSFGRLQERSQLTQAADVARAARSRPATYFVFDLLSAYGFDLRPLPLVARKMVLAKLLSSSTVIRYADHVETEGEALFAEIEGMGLEGVMAKRADSPYRGGRHADWQKTRIWRSGDFVVVGYTRPERSRVGAGAFHLAARGAGDELVYVGAVGSGFSARELSELVAELDESRRSKPVFVGPGPERQSGHVWCEPRLVLEVKFSEWSTDGHLRQPTFVRRRSPSDKLLREIDRRR